MWYAFKAKYFITFFEYQHMIGRFYKLTRSAIDTSYSFEVYLRTLIFDIQPNRHLYIHLNTTIYVNVTQRLMLIFVVTLCRSRQHQEFLRHSFAHLKYIFMLNSVCHSQIKLKWATVVNILYIWKYQKQIYLCLYHYFRLEYPHPLCFIDANGFGRLAASITESNGFTVKDISFSCIYFWRQYMQIQNFM